MNNRILLLSAISITFLSSVLVSHVFVGAAEPTQFTPEETCRNRVHHELGQVLDEYRAHLFGSRKATKGSSYILRTGGSAEVETRGIFETRGRLTSELVDPLVESYRVMRCRALAVCDVMLLSSLVPLAEGTKDLTIERLGCEDIAEKSYSECRLVGDSILESAPQSSATNMIQECAGLVKETLAMEQAALRLSVGYDSGYRSMLQFSGMTDWILQGLPNRALPTMTQTINLLGKLHQIPCFIGQCDAPNTSALNR